MTLTFYGIERARREDWMLMEYPAPVTVPLKCRDEYDKRLLRFRRRGAIIVGFAQKNIDAPRTWFYGLPRTPLDMDWMEQQARQAGMMEPPESPRLTFRWIGGDKLRPDEVAANAADDLTDMLSRLAKDKRLPETVRMSALAACARLAPMPPPTEGPRKEGRPPIPEERKLLALKVKGTTLRARVLHATNYPTRSQVKNVSNILAYFRKVQKQKRAIHKN